MAITKAGRAVIKDFPFSNKIFNGSFNINQRAYVSGAAVGAGLYGHDRWKMAASADTYTFSTTANKTTITIPAGKVLIQVIEGLNLQTGTYVLCWEGTAQGKIGAGALGASGITGSIVGGVDTSIEFGPGTLSDVRLVDGEVITPFKYRSYAEELRSCHRYYQRGLYVSSFVASGTVNAAGHLTFHTPMRVTPVISSLSPYTIMNGSATFTQSSVSFTQISNPFKSTLNLGNFTGLTSNAVYITGDGSSGLTASAEL